MIRNSKTATARYLVFAQSVSANGATLEKRFCDNIAEARKAARELTAANPGLSNALANGYKPGNVPAAMVRYGTERYGRLPLATKRGENRAEIGIIAY